MPSHAWIYTMPYTTGPLSVPSAIPYDTRTSITLNLHTTHFRIVLVALRPSAFISPWVPVIMGVPWSRAGWGGGEAWRCGASVPSVPRGLIPKTCLPAVSWYQLCDVKRRVDVALTDYQNTSMSPSLCLKIRSWFAARLMRGNRFRMSDCCLNRWESIHFLPLLFV